VKKDGLSTYTINGKKATKGDVVTALKNKGIDLDHNRFLILQGEAEQISLMKPKGANENETGLLEYLEDIIGSNQFVEVIQSSYEQVEKISEERTAVSNRLRAIGKELDSLRKPVQEAKAYLTTSAEVIRSEGIIKQIEHMNVRMKTEKLERDVKRKEEVLESEKKAQEENQTVLRKCEAKYNTSLKEVTKLQKQLEVVKADWVDFEKNELTLNNDIKHKNTLIKKEQTKKTKVEGNITSNTNQQKVNSRDLEDYSKELEELNEGLENAESELEDIYHSLQ
jgi:structural maintenance of chromosome 4